MSCKCKCKGAYSSKGPKGDRGPAGPAGNLAITNITWAALNNLVNTSALTEGYYRITNYKTTGNIPNTATALNVAIEPLIVFAIDVDKLYHQAWSEQFPQDIIYYELNDTSTQGATLGRIYYREGTEKRLIAPYDWRKWVFRRWETAVGSGIFSQITDPGGGEASQDFYTFGDSTSGGTCSDIEINEISARDIALNSAPSNSLNNITIGPDSSDCIFKSNWDLVFEQGNGLNRCTFEAGVNTLEFFSSTHVYSNYTCNIFLNANFDAKLSYFDAADALNVVLPTT